MLDRGDGTTADGRVNRERLDMAMKAAGLGRFEWDLERDVLSVSPEFAALTGLPAGEMAATGGRAWDRWVRPEDRGFLLRSRDDALSGDAFRLEVRMARPDDGRRLAAHVRQRGP